MFTIRQYVTPAVAALATAASLAATFGQTSSPPSGAAAVNQLTAEEKRDGWKLLFDGTSLDGWRAYKRPDVTGTRWKIEDGMLTLDPGDSKDTRGARDIITSAKYEQFELSWEWKVAQGGNSGVKYFVLEDMDSAIGHEYQIIDDERHPDAKIGPHRQTAAFYDVLPVSVPPAVLQTVKKPAGEWNHSKIRVDECRPRRAGSCVSHYLNNVRVLEYELDSPELRTAIAKSKFKDVARFGKRQPGHILFQDHGDRVWYRNIKILELAAPANQSASATGIQITPNDSARRVDVTIDGKPFTSYIYPDSIKKPVLYPLRTASGTFVTRGFPLDPRPGERVDHPHHVGLWFNHGDVNGLDFWNNSDAIPAARAPKMGTIRHSKVLEVKNGADRGELAVAMDWLQPDGTALLREQTRFVFSSGPNVRRIDRLTTLTAVDKRVVFKDNKEGMIGLRVARALEQPADKPEIFTDASGQATKVAVLDNAGVTGQYLSSEGLKGDAVWGTRGRWCLLTGKIEAEPIGIAILDHPTNPNAPTYWHARGYGLFAANPLGRKVFKSDQEELVLTLEPGESVTYRFRVVIRNDATSADDIEREYRAFAAATSSSR